MADPTDRLPGVTFRAERLLVIAAAERSHFWHAPRRRLLLETLERTGARSAGPVLDVGCGTGAIVAALADEGYDVRGLDPWADDMGLRPPRFRRGAIDAIPWPDDSFASVCAFDVLEHVDERTALAELRRVHRPGGRLFVSVPAYQMLWGPRDEVAGHRRRYSRATLRRALVAAGYEVEAVFGFQLFLLPATVASRLLGKWRRRRELAREDAPPVWLNAILRGINLAEVALGRFWRPPIGSSLIAIAQKPIDPCQGAAPTRS